MRHLLPAITHNTLTHWAFLSFGAVCVLLVLAATLRDLDVSWKRRRDISRRIDGRWK